MTTPALEPQAAEAQEDVTPAPESPLPEHQQAEAGAGGEDMGEAGNARSAQDTGTHQTPVRVLFIHASLASS